MTAEPRFQRSSDDADRQWCDWEPSPAYSVGIEEEVMLLDPAAWSLAQRIEEVLACLPAAIASHVGAETHQAAIELACDPHGRVGPAISQLGDLRAALAWSLRSLGLRAAGGGMHPTEQRATRACRQAAATS